MAKDTMKASAFLIQFGATVIVAYLCSLIGLIYCWPSYTADMFTSNATALSAPMTSLQKDLMGSLTNIGGLVMTPFCGVIIEKLGRKYAAMLFGLPFVISWSVIMVTTNINLVLFSMFFAGFGAAGQVVSSVYISEIVDDSIRGGLTTATVAGYYAGVLVSYVLGGLLSYRQVAYTHLSISLFYILLLMLLRESPVFLVQRGRDEEAVKSIAFYRRAPAESKEVQIELNKIRRLFEPQFNVVPQTDPKDLMQENTNYEPKTMSPWRFLLNSPSSQRALVVCLMLMTLTIMMGTVVLQVYAEPLFKNAVPSMSSNLCAILLALDFLLSSLISAVITDRVGRKILTTCSSTAAGVCTMLLGLQLHKQFAPHWFTAFIIYLYVFVYTLGAATTPFVLTAEVFLPEVKSLCNSITLGSAWVTYFITLIIFNPLVQIIGLGPMFYGFSGVCFVGALYSHFYLPETKGLPVDAIQQLFYKKRHSLTLSPHLS